MTQMVRAGLAAFVLAVALTGCTSGSRTERDHSPPGGAPAGREVTVSAQAHGGAVRCIAHFPSSTIVPGAPTGVRFTVENVSDPGFSISESAGNGQAGYLIERSTSGTLIQDTSHVHDGIIGGMALPEPIPVGSTRTLPSYDPPILHPGPILVTPMCPLTPKTVRLPQVRLQVFAPGPVPSAADAIRRSVAAAGSAFSRCTPTQDQEWVMGVSRTVSGTPFNARCGALVLHNRGFLIVLLGIVSPPHAPAIDLADLSNQLGATPSIGVTDPVAVSLWVFVATNGAVQLVGRLSVAHDCEGTLYQVGGGVLSCRFPTR